ncbi:MAG TPA: DUF1552 domain-containing protein [Verrucomicrobiales bacterium]|nr:DUF1552 domain-containing protein [Verrucomicrobiales bacterium]
MNSPHLAARPIHRRHFLRGVGVTLALPWLEGMSPLFGKTQPEPPQRMLLISNNLGVLPGPFFPKDQGPAYKASPYLEILAPFRKDFTVFSGLSHPNVSGGHSTENCFLTAAKDPTGSGFRNTISLDQYAIEQLGQQTRFPTLNLGVNIDKANRSLSWTRDGVLLPAEDKPSALFRRMFVQGSPDEVARRMRQLQDRGSILDAVTADMSGFQKTLGSDDRDRLDQYFTSVRELEERLHTAGEWEQQPKPVTDQAPPEDIADPAKFFAKFSLMLGMAQLAFESDSTRIVTLMVDGFATPVFEIRDGEKSLNDYHNLSHHGQSKEKLAQLERVDRRQMEVLRTLFERLAAKDDGGSRLLDRTMVLYGSNLGDANVHNTNNLPVLLAGGGFKHGAHLAFDGVVNKPLGNLFVSMLQQMGVETGEFASGTGTLAGLEAG